MRYLLLVFALVAAAPAGAVVLNQVDDFQDGTTQNWITGFQNPNPPVNAPNAGPAGAGDHSLLITSTGGGGPGSRFVGFNVAQWSGDYLTAGVQEIQMDVNNVGAVPLNVRIAIEGAGGRFASTVAVGVAAGSGWQSISLPIAPGDLTSVGGLDVNATLGSVTVVRVLSSASPAFLGDAIVAQGLFDNVRACPCTPPPAGVPAMTPWGLAGLGLALLVGALRLGLRRTRA